MINSNDIALKLLPKGYRFNIVPLREEIAETIDRIVKEEITSYKESQLSQDIKKLEKELKDKETFLLQKEQYFHREKEEFNKIVKGHLNLLSSMEIWMEWFEGKHLMADYKTLWDSVKEAWKNYKSLKNSPE